MVKVYSAIIFQFRVGLQYLILLALIKFSKASQSVNTPVTLDIISWTWFPKFKKFSFSDLIGGKKFSCSELIGGEKFSCSVLIGGKIFSTSGSAILAATALSFLFNIFPRNRQRSLVDTIQDKVWSLSRLSAISYGITSTLPSRLGPPPITRAPCVSVLDRWLVRHLRDLWHHHQQSSIRHLMPTICSWILLQWLDRCRKGRSTVQFLPSRFLKGHLNFVSLNSFFLSLVERKFFILITWVDIVVVRMKADW